MPHCTQCQQPATVRFAWPTTTGPQSANLCQDHASAWWKQYQHTPAGLGLQISPAEGQKEAA